MRVAVASAGGAAFATMTVTGADVVVLPAASRATAVSVCDPSATVVVFQLIPYGEMVSAGADLHAVDEEGDGRDAAVVVRAGR